MASFFAFIVVIGICVIVHEFGHFRTARFFDVQVHEFAFGMGPVLFQREKNGTLWSLRAFPIGGFVRLAGMEEEAEGELVQPGKAFYDKAAWKRFFILFNGAATNLVLALLLTAVFLAGHGVTDLDRTVVGEIMEGYPAQTAGILPGDAILTVNGRSVDNWKAMSENIREEALKGPVGFTVRRGEQTLSLSVTIPPSGDGEVRLLGIRPAMRRYSPMAAITSAFSYTVSMSVEMLRGIGRWVTGAEKADVAGPLGIATMAGEAARKGIWTFLSFLALINLNLGLINLLPFPALDGGRLFFTAGEMLLGRRLPPKIENYIHMSGFILLILLILYVTWQDLLRIF